MYSISVEREKKTIIKARSFNFDTHFVVKTKSHRGKRKLEKLERESENERVREKRKKKRKKKL